jgi:hypothetical protein
MLVQRYAANEAPKDTIQDAHSKIVRLTGSSMNIKKYAMG